MPGVPLWLHHAITIAVLAGPLVAAVAVLILLNLWQRRQLAGWGDEAPAADVPPGGGGEDRPPWERPGAVRRDVEPYSGLWPRALGVLALTLCALSLCFGLTGLLGLPLAVAVWVLAGRDLARMRAGALDPAGRAQAVQARRLAAPAIALAVFGLGFYGSLLTLMWLMP